MENWVAFIPFDGQEPYVNVGDSPHFALLEEGMPEMELESNMLAAGHLPESSQGIFAKGEITPGGYVKFDSSTGDRNLVADIVYDFLTHTAAKKEQPFLEPTNILEYFVSYGDSNKRPREQDVEDIKEFGMGLASLPRGVMGEYMERIMASKYPAAVIRLAQQTKCLRFMLPLVEESVGFWQRYENTSSELFQHLLLTLEYVADRTSDRDLRWAALLHDVGKIRSVWVDEDGRTRFRKGPEGQGENHEEVGPEMAKEIFDDLEITDYGRICFFILMHMFKHFDNKKGAKAFIKEMGSKRNALDMLILRGGDVQGKPKQEEGEEEIEEMKELIEKVSKGDEDDVEYKEDNLLDNVLVVYVANKEAGYVSYEPRDDAVEIKAIQVYPKYRRQGLATGLMNRLANKYRDKKLITEATTPLGKELVQSLETNHRISIAWEKEAKPWEDGDLPKRTSRFVEAALDPNSAIKEIEKLLTNSKFKEKWAAYYKANHPDISQAVLDQLVEGVNYYLPRMSINIPFAIQPGEEYIDEEDLAYRGGDGPYGYGGYLAEGFVKEYNFKDKTKGRGGYLAVYDFFRLITDKIVNEKLSDDDFRNFLDLIEIPEMLARIIVLWDYLRTYKYAKESRDYAEISKEDAQRFSQNPELFFKYFKFFPTYGNEYSEFAINPTSKKDLGDSIRDATDNTEIIRAALRIINDNLFTTNVKYIARTQGLGGVPVEIPDFDSDSGPRDPSWEVFELTEEIDLVLEGAALRHCIGSSSDYFRYTEQGKAAHFSIRRGGVPVVTITLAKYVDPETQIPEYALSQIKSNDNGWFPFESTQMIKHFFQELDIQILSEGMYNFQDFPDANTPEEYFYKYILSGDREKFDKVKESGILGSSACTNCDVSISAAFKTRSDKQVLGEYFYEPYLLPERVYSDARWDLIFEYINRFENPNELIKALEASYEGIKIDLPLVRDRELPKRTDISDITEPFADRILSFPNINKSNNLKEYAMRSQTVFQFVSHISHNIFYNNDLNFKLNSANSRLIESIINSFIKSVDLKYFLKLIEESRSPTLFTGDIQSELEKIFDPIVESLGLFYIINDNFYDELVRTDYEETRWNMIPIPALMPDKLANNYRIDFFRKFRESNVPEQSFEYEETVESEYLLPEFMSDRAPDVYASTALMMIDGARRPTHDKSDINFLKKLFTDDIRELETIESFLRYISARRAISNEDVPDGYGNLESIVMNISDSEFSMFEKLLEEAVGVGNALLDDFIEKKLTEFGFKKYDENWKIPQPELFGDQPTWYANWLSKYIKGFTTQDLKNVLIEFKKNSGKVMNKYYRDPALFGILTNFYDLGDSDTDFTVIYGAHFELVEEEFKTEKAAESEQLPLFQEVKIPEWAEGKDFPSEGLQKVHDPFKEKYPSVFQKPITPDTSLLQIYEILRDKLQSMRNEAAIYFIKKYIIPEMEEYISGPRTNELRDEGAHDKLYEEKKHMKNLIAHMQTTKFANTLEYWTDIATLKNIIDDFIDGNDTSFRMMRSVFKDYYSYSDEAHVDLGTMWDAGLKDSDKLEEYEKLKKYYNIFYTTSGDALASLSLSSLSNPEWEYKGDPDDEIRHDLAKGTKEYIREIIRTVIKENDINTLGLLLNDFGLQSELDGPIRTNYLLDEDIHFAGYFSGWPLLPKDDIMRVEKLINAFSERMNSDRVGHILEIVPEYKDAVLEMVSDIAEKNDLPYWEYWPEDYWPQEVTDWVLKEEYESGEISGNAPENLPDEQTIQRWQQMQQPQRPVIEMQHPQRPAIEMPEEQAPAIQSLDEDIKAMLMLIPNEFDRNQIRSGLINTGTYTFSDLSARPRSTYYNVLGDELGDILEQAFIEHTRRYE